MKIPMSQRLLACCGYVNKGDREADVGTDHGYLGIWLLTNGLARGVIASDIAPQPLEAARRNARKFRVDSAMEFYLSDGAKDIPRDFDVMICAGMGADTIISILERSSWLRSENYRLILQCQSRRPQLRHWLYGAGYRIRRETLARDGRFIYTVMEVSFDPGGSFTPAQAYISPQLLEDAHPLLPAYYERVVSGLRQSVEGMSHSGNQRLEEYRGILAELENMEEQVYGNRR